MRLWQRSLGALTAVIATAVLAPAAMASVSATQSLDQSAGTSAGGAHNLGLTLNFSDSGTDSPEHLTLKLPPGLLADTAADNGQCLKSNLTPSSACQIGSGTVTVHPDVTITTPLPILGGVPVPVPTSIPLSVTFYLVPPPSGSDLAGIEVYSSQLGTQIGSTGPITVRPSGDPDGVGATVALTLPDTLPSSILPAALVPLVNSTINISITEIQSTFDNLRYPTTCPAREPFITSFDSYGGSAQTLSSPLSVTGCGSLSYNPKFAVTATKDPSDKEVALTTNVTQGATEAPNGSIALSFPTSLFAADLRALGQLCLTSVSSCTTVGSVTAVSPLYPTPLTGQAYLTGSAAGLSLTLTFPQPFPLTLVGSVSLVTNTAAFSGLPDIPLSSLSVKLNGGSKGLFATACRQSSGTATARFTDQNGDQTRNVPASFSVSGCNGASSGSGGSGSGGSGSGGSGSGGAGSSGSSSGSTSSSWTTSSSGSRAAVRGTSLRAKSIFGLTRGKPSLRFLVAVGRRYAKFTRLTVMLPAGLRVRFHRAHKHTVIRGISVTGAKARSLRLSHGHLVITLRRSARRVTVAMGSAGLGESHALRAQAQSKKLKRLHLKVAVRDVKHHTRTLTVTLRKLHL